MMKLPSKIGVALALMIGGASAGNAQDAGTYSWSGFYVGGNIGYGSFDSSSSYDPNNHYYDVRGDGVTNLANPPPPGAVFSSSLTDRNGGVIGGGQIGFNYQSGQLVAGVEADLAFADLNTSTSKEYCEYCEPEDNGDPAKFYYKLSQRTESSLSALGTLRARIGFAFDRSLLYATGGLAYAKVHDVYRIAGNDDSGDPDGTFSVSESGWRAGYVVGGGFEHALSQTMTVKLEGLYYDLGTTHLGTSEFNKFQFTDFSSFNQTIEHDGVIGRTGLNVRF